MSGSKQKIQSLQNDIDELNQEIAGLKQLASKLSEAASHSQDKETS